MVQIEEDAHHVRCIISPNHSISWRQLRVCIFVFALVSLTIAGFWALQGAWVIVPFAGLEVAVVYVFLRKVSARVHAAEVLEFDAERISLVWGQGRPQGHLAENRDNATLECWHPHHDWSPPRLMLRASRQCRQIAQHCNKQDCEAVLILWRAQSLPVVYHGETHIHPHPDFDKQE